MDYSEKMKKEKELEERMEEIRKRNSLSIRIQSDMFYDGESDIDLYDDDNWQ